MTELSDLPESPAGSQDDAPQAAPAINIADAEAQAKLAQLNMQAINMLASVRSAVMNKIVYDLAVESGKPEEIRYSKLLLMASLRMLTNYPSADKMYDEAIKLPQFAEDCKRFKQVMDHLDKAEIAGAQVVMRAV